MTTRRGASTIALLVAVSTGCSGWQAVDEPTVAPSTDVTTAAPTPTATPTPSPTPTPAVVLPELPSTEGRRLALLETILGDISPKSVVASPTGLVFAQNMMYRHTMTVYDSTFSLVTTIVDEISLAQFDVEGADADETVRGAPVEADFTSDGRYAYVSNYQMYGSGYDNPGHDGCSASDGWDRSFVYRVDTDLLEIDQVIGVGAVPKYVAVTPDDQLVLVTNWCTYDLSVIDVARGVEIERLQIGRFPRGIAVSQDSTTAWVAVMGSFDIAVVDLTTFDVSYLEGVGRSPRHLVLSPDDRWLYATLNGEGRVVKIDTSTGRVVASVATGAAPRSMDISVDGHSLYVVNYNDDTMSKVSTADMEEVQQIPTNAHPIGITYDPLTGNIWVANYSGSIMVFEEQPA